MKLPGLTALPRKKTTVTRFGGYEHSERAGIDSFYDMADMTSDKYPLLATRHCRRRWTRTGGEGSRFPDGIFTLTGESINSAVRINERIVFCTDTAVYVNGEPFSGLTLENIRPLQQQYPDR